MAFRKVTDGAPHRFTVRAVSPLLVGQEGRKYHLFYVDKSPGAPPDDYLFDAIAGSIAFRGELEQAGKPIAGSTYTALLARAGNRQSWKVEFHGHDPGAIVSPEEAGAKRSLLPPSPPAAPRPELGGSPATMFEAAHLSLAFCEGAAQALREARPGLDKNPQAFYTAMIVMAVQAYWLDAQASHQPGEVAILGASNGSRVSSPVG